MKQIGVALILLIAGIFSGCVGGSPPLGDSYSVSGRVTDAELVGIADVDLYFEPGSSIATTTSTGAWSRGGLNGTVIVTPFHDDYHFDPVSREVNSGSSDADFIAILNGTDPNEIPVTDEWEELHTVHRTTSDHAMLHVAWSPDSERIVTAGQGDVYIWDWTTDTLLRTLNAPRSPVTDGTYATYSLDWSGAEGKYIVTGTYGNIAAVWDLEEATNDFAYTLSHEDDVTSVGFSPDGTRLATGARKPSVQFGGEVKLWDLVNGASYINSYTGHNMYVYALEWSPSGSFIVSGGFDQEAVVWNPNTLSEEYTSGEHSFWLQAVAWSPDEQFVVGGSFESMAVWSLTDDQNPVQEFAFPNWVNSVSWSPDGNYIACTSNGGLYLTDVNTWEQWEIPTIGWTVSGVSWSPCGEYLASTGSAFVTIWGLARR